MQTRRVDGSAPQTFEPEADPFFPEKEPAPLPEYRDHADENLRMFASNAAATAPTTTKPAPNDRVLYVGLNTATADGMTRPQNELEWASLKYLSPTAERVQDSVSSVVDGFDLSKKTDIAGFVKTLGLDAGKSEAVAKVLEGASVEGRDELAGIAKVLARAETGGTVPSRWILSGHYGDRISDGASGNGLETKDVCALAKAMPKGAAHVEDIMISGCYSGGKDQLAAFQAAFPNLRTAIGYGVQGGHDKADQSPTGANAVAHIQEWEIETRGRGAPSHMRQTVHAVGAENISWWDGTYHAAHAVKP